MSIQIHAPSPVLSMRSRSPAPVPSSSARGRSQSRRRDSCERPSSPLSHHAQLPPLQRSPMTRPSSRSERLLRDTLRRAEEHDRMLNVHPLPSSKVIGASLPGSPFLSPTGVLTMPNNVVPANSHSSRRHSRRNTASSIATSASCDDCERLYEPPVAVDQDDEYEDVEERNGGQWRGQVGGAHPSSPSHHYQAMPMQPGLSRNRSLTSRSGDAKRTFSEANTKAQMAYGTPTSPTPVRTRSTTSASRRHSYSHAQSHSHSNSRTSFDGEHPVRSSHQSSTVVTPHDAVLRSRLEGVLRNAKEQERREKSSERRYKDAGSSNGSGSGSRNSMASSRNLSAEGDLFFGAGGESSVTSLSSVDVKPSATAVAPSRTSLSSTRSAPTGFSFPARSPPMSNMPLRPPGTPSRQRASPTSSHSSGVSPLTPPPSPPFNARTAAEQCKAMDGYVSFATIEGLGVPEGYEDDDNEDDDGNGRGRWWQWLTIASKSRDRSASIHSGISR
ncbi:hypothetical protein POSPLADRAFT_1031092 [Postia placenta MAD-698-R-SB12]|uniref:Uncharacterized protein n=1 Tax=Postia placenta MAD-698-R-SB12 TaxID=670580 RepID=A0A1X6NB16_9APHY|nr:hypothetical protein POSPLADRAFT_1031092 [Postia placenta MAD-698-R-SB12]OSX65838.1 hypothetical protein POSPLADRAFT_1031092 [Postia placenta MAD-698-R-SB12]